MTLFAGHDVEALLLKTVVRAWRSVQEGWLPADGRPRRLPLRLSINTAPRRTACTFSRVSAAEVTSPARDDPLVTDKDRDVRRRTHQLRLGGFGDRWSHDDNGVGAPSEARSGQRRFFRGS